VPLERRELGRRVPRDPPLARQASDGGARRPGWCVDAFPSVDRSCAVAERWRPWRVRVHAFLADARDGGEVLRRDMRNLAVTALLLPALSRAESNRVVEIRSYNLKPGTRERFTQVPGRGSADAEALSGRRVVRSIASTAIRTI
jgi:hypothetical protein